MSLSSNTPSTSANNTIERQKSRRATNASFNEPDPLIQPLSSSLKQRRDFSNVNVKDRSRGRRPSVTFSPAENVSEGDASPRNGEVVVSGASTQEVARRPRLGSIGSRASLYSDHLALASPWGKFMDENDRLGLQLKHLAETRKSVLERTKEIEETVDRIVHLREVSKYLLDAHDEGEARGLEEIEALIASVKDFMKEQGSIMALRNRLDMEGKKVEMCDDRLRAISKKMADVQLKEQLWREKQSKRLRYVWGLVSLLLFIWLLMSIVPMQDSTKLEPELDPLAPERLITEEDLEDISSPQVIFGLSRDSESAARGLP